MEDDRKVYRLVGRCWSGKTGKRPFDVENDTHIRAGNAEERAEAGREFLVSAVGVVSGCSEVWWGAGGKFFFELFHDTLLNLTMV